jgi:putative two-component system response regulator
MLSATEMTLRHDAPAQVQPARDLHTASGDSTPPARRAATEGAKIMIVDDEPLTIEVVKARLQVDGYRHIVETDHAASALWTISAEQPDLLLLDIHMPPFSGLDLLQEIRRDHRLAPMPVIMLTAATDHDVKLRALELGATDFLQKPIHGGELRARLRNILMAKAYQDQLRDQSQALEQAVRQRTAELEASRREVIHCLARAAEFRDDDTGQHVLRVGRYARIIGAELGLAEATLDVLEPAAQLHDIGKIGIPDAILLKPGRLTPEEFEFMQKHCNFGKCVVQPMPETESCALRQHTELGARILDAGRSPILAMAMRIAMTHHERWDGTGYPLGLAGEDIPLEGRITAVADVFDALGNKRPYKPPFPLDKCFSILEEGRGTHFDPRMLDAFVARRDEIVQVQIAYADSE